jgi:hypothetical protein
VLEQLAQAVELNAKLATTVRAMRYILEVMVLSSPLFLAPYFYLARNLAAIVGSIPVRVNVEHLAARGEDISDIGC